MARKMKDSGIEWIGEIPEEWKIKRLKHISNIRSGNGITNQQLNDYGMYDVWGGNGFIGKTNQYNVDGEKLIIGRVGALCGNVRFSNEKKFISDNALILKFIDNENITFNYYLLLAANLGNLNTSNAQPLITGTKVLNVFIPSVNYEQQTRIAIYLDNKCTKIDETIEKEKQVIEKLNEYKQSVITEAVTKGLNPDVRMKDSGIEWIGKIPEHWDIKRLKFLGDLSSSGVDKKIREDEQVYKSVHFMDVMRNSLGNIRNSEDYLVISADNTKAEKCILKKADVLFTNSSETPEDMGHSTVVYEDLENTLYGYHLMRFRPLINIDVSFEKYLFGCYYMRKWFEYRSMGMTRFGLSRIDFTDAIIILPIINEQKQIADYLDQKCDGIDKAILNKENLIKKLLEYKKSLIYECVTGKREV